MFATSLISFVYVEIQIENDSKWEISKVPHNIFAIQGPVYSEGREKQSAD